jgi:hypothetical protein
MSTATLPAERRVAPRRQPAMGTVFRLDTDGPPEIGLIWNISLTGVSMLRNEPPAAGARLTGLLETMSDAHAIRIGMTVVHVKQLDTGDYFLGCHFDRKLTEDEIKPFVA